MDVRSPIFQNIACVLMGVMFLNPIVGTAADLALDAAAGGNANIGSASNGVPMVNIATPNGSGLSHNKFTDYNVGQQGLILNNSNQSMVNTQLGGYVVGNPNLKGGTASVILNEVNGGSPSQLKGYTEVAGRSAHVIVANPHGITCDGCGFLNTPRATLTTGTPVVENGRLDRYDVDGGEIAIEGEGLNARNVDQFELITRSAKINAELHAQKLAMITGRNEVDAADLSATAKAANGSAAPQLAIDSSALGGMYAGAIRLVGTEQGVGVKLAGDMAASGGDIHIDANGQLSLARTAASGDATLRAEQIELNDDTYAGRNATLQADRVNVGESLAAGNRLQVDSDQLNNAGIIEAGVRADGSLNSAGHLQLNGGQVDNQGSITSHGSLATDVQTLNNQGGTLTAASDATLKADALNNHNGQVLAQRDLTIQAATSDNRAGELLAGRDLSVSGASLDNQGGTLAANGAIKTDLSAALNNTSGLVEAGTHLDISAGSLSNDSGRLRALGNSGMSRFVIGARFDNDNGKVEIGNAELNLTSASLSNQAGLVRHLGTQGFNLSLADLGNAGGSFITNGDLTLDADDWSNSSVLQANRLNLRFGTFQQTATGKLLSATDIVIRGEDWLNDGTIAADGLIDLQLTGFYNGNGQLTTQQGLVFTAASADLGTQARISAGEQADFTLGGTLLSRGVITADAALNLHALELDNHGTLGSAGTLTLTATNLKNTDGLIFSGGDLHLIGQRFTNLRGDLYSVGDLSFIADASNAAPQQFSNLSGVIESEGDIDIRASRIENAHELETLVVSRKVSALFYGRDCTDCSGDKENVRYYLSETDRTEALSNVRTASLLAGGNLSLHATDVKNRYSLMAANGDIKVDALTFENLGAETGETITVRRVTSDRQKSVGFIDNAVARFNATYSSSANGDITAAVNSMLASYFPYRTAPSTTYTPEATQRYAGIVQAGGDVQINALQIGNGSIRPSFSFASGGTRVDTGAPGSDIATQVTLNPQLPPDLQQKAVDPLALPGFTVPSGQNGLFSLNLNPDHPYLIETNPAFASLKGFLNSDYMLDLLGYDLNTVQRRLGDGYYEQRLIREAIVARTGQRYLAGLDSDEAQFRYLMDNAVASKEALNLSVGVSLSAEQIAALTHDIVWMEEREVNGVKVLAPVLYLAQAEGRLAPGGALIQGRDVALISGTDLNNSGTLRATRNLDVTARQNIANSGLMHANERLSLLAGDSIRNSQGGIIKGQDVSLIAVSGDVINERSITTHQSQSRNSDRQQSFVDSAARIEAGNDLVVSAGRDLLNIGGAISAGGDASLQAGNDLLITSAEAQNRQNTWDRKGYLRQSDVTQYGSDVQIGGDLQASAGRDLAVIASKVKAGGDIDLYANGDVTIASAANQTSLEYRHKGGGKKVEREEQQVRQQASVIEAGGNLSVVAEGNLALVSSHLKAGNEAYLYAGEQLALLAAQNSDYSLYDKKKKGGWGSKETQRDEVTKVRNIGSSITTGGDLILVSEGDQLYQRARLESGNDLILDSGGAITFEAVKDLDQESHEKSKNSWAWTSMEGEGSTDETVLQSQLIAKGETLIKAVEGIHIDVRVVNQETVSQAIDAMVTADPDLAWLKEAEQRGDIDWRRVKEIHDSWDYDHSGLGGPLMIIIAIIVTYFTAGTASGLVAGAGSAVGGAGSAIATATAVGTAANVAGTAVLTSMASSATISAINNKGNLGAVVKDVTSEDALRGYLVSGITAGLTKGVFDNWTGTETGAAGALPNSGNVVANGGLSSLEGIGRFAGNQLLQNGTSAVLDRALGGDSSLSDALRSSLANTFAAAGFDLIGDLTAPGKWDLKDGSPSKILLHAVMGGLAAEAAGGDFKTGALAAGINEALVDILAQQYGAMDAEERKGLLVMNSQVIGVLAATAQGGDETALQTGAWVAGTATQYNYLFHAEIEQMLDEQDACKSLRCKQDIAERYAELSNSRNEGIADLCGRSPATCDAILDRLAAEEPAVFELAKQQARLGKTDAAFVIGFAIAQDNSIAANIIVRELRGTTEFQGAMIDAMVATATGGAGRGGPKSSGAGKAGAGSSVGAKGNSVAGDFFEGTKYTDKVLGQIKTGDLHAFPESVKAFQEAGQITKITGGDGVVRDMLKIPGEYRGKQGVFEFIKEPDGTINHRLFKPNPGQ